jgi:hypothetical protein
MALQPDVLGVKGSPCYSEEAVGDLRVSLFSLLVRGSEVSHLVRRAFRKHPEDIVVMAFQTRDIRGGKGERALFQAMMKEILAADASLAPVLIPLIPTYGRWDDVWKLYGVSSAVNKAIDEVVLQQFCEDQESESPSLLAKWLPREGKALSHHFADLLFPLVPKEHGRRMRSYRRTVAFLNKTLGTVEINMCGGSWASIQPGSVPGQCLSRNKGAFMNLRGKHSSEDRVMCADNFRRFVEDTISGKKKINGGQTTMPHEHVKGFRGCFSSPDGDNVIEAQWNSVLEETRAAGGLGRVVFMCDFSGSMEGTPRDVSLALGILGSQVSTVPGFRNRILTFDSTPTWHRFEENATLRQKVESVGFLGMGTSTNFLAACMLILQGLIDGAVPVSEAPTHLIVITDMGFDAAAGLEGNESWATHFQKIRQDFGDAGYEPPLIVNWNVSASYTDAHATANEVGVVQMSGWSPSLLKMLQGGITVVTPMEGLRKILDDPRYDAVREAFAEA